MVQFSSLLGVAVSPKGNPAIFQCVCTFLQLTLFYSDHIRIVQAIFIQNSFCKVQRNQKFSLTTLQSIMNAKLSKQRFWHCYENGLIKTIQMIPHN